MARIVLAATGSLGDVYPLIAIALALRARGLDPLLAAAEPFRPYADAEGLPFRPVRPGPAEMLRAGIDEAAAVRAVAGDVAAIFDLLLPHLEDAHADMAAALTGADFLVASGFSIAARVAADAARIPFATVLFQPIAFMSRVDPPVIGDAPVSPRIQRRVPAPVVRLLYALARARFASRRAPVNGLRARLGLPPADELLEGPFRGSRVFALYPPAFAPLAPDAPAHALGTGFSFYNGAHPAALDPALGRFLDAGPPPLVFSLGSLVVHAPGDFYADGAAAARALGRRAVLLVGDHALPAQAHLAGPDVHVAGAAPHAALFPRAAAVIHHGGIGTAAQALRAGVPHLVCPALGDQFDNAERLRELGVARTLRLSRHTPPRATAELRRLLADPAAAAKARALAPAMAAADGPALVAEGVRALLAAR